MSLFWGPHKGLAGPILPTPCLLAAGPKHAHTCACMPINGQYYKIMAVL